MNFTIGYKYRDPNLDWLHFTAMSNTDITGEDYWLVLHKYYFSITTNNKAGQYCVQRLLAGSREVSCLMSSHNNISVCIRGE
jgi:hypothetical protein